MINDDQVRFYERVKKAGNAMGKSISVSLSGTNPAGTGVAGGSGEIEQLFEDMARLVEESRPDIYLESFESLDWGEIHLERLDKDDFKYVSRLFEAEYTKFIDRHPGGEDKGRVQIFTKLIQIIRSDPKYSE